MESRHGSAAIRVGAVEQVQRAGRFLCLFLRRRRGNPVMRRVQRQKSLPERRPPPQNLWGLSGLGEARRVCAVGVCTSGTGDSRRGVGPRLLPLDIATRIRGGLSPRASPASGGLERCSGAPGAASGAVGPIVGRLIRTHRQPNSPTDFAEDPNKDRRGTTGGVGRVVRLVTPKRRPFF